jgi:hypothetical protein
VRWGSVRKTRPNTLVQKMSWRKLQSECIHFLPCKTVYFAKVAAVLQHPAAGVVAAALYACRSAVLCAGGAGHPPCTALQKVTPATTTVDTLFAAAFVPL